MSCKCETCGCEHHCHHECDHCKNDVCQTCNCKHCNPNKNDEQLWKWQDSGIEIGF